METIETERLILRGWCLADAEALYDYAKNPNVGPPAGWKPHESVEESRDILENLFLKKYEIWAIVQKDTGKVVGSIGFEEDVKRPGITTCKELGYAMAEECWGKGLMTEAAKATICYGFEEMGLSMISIGRGPANHRSGRVIEKCGFVEEGTLRQAYCIYDGTLRDTRCYSMTKDEFEAQEWR